MKLIFCPQCLDIFRLFDEPRSCKCGRCSGYYKDAQNAEVTGNPVMIGFDNTSFVKAVRKEPEMGLGECFTAFVIPHKCRTIERRDFEKEQEGNPLKLIPIKGDCFKDIYGTDTLYIPPLTYCDRHGYHDRETCPECYRLAKKEESDA